MGLWMLVGRKKAERMMITNNAMFKRLILAGSMRESQVEIVFEFAHSNINKLYFYNENKCEPSFLFQIIIIINSSEIGY